MKFLKQFLSELTQTGGRVWDFDLNQTRGKHSSFLNFPFAKVVLLAAEVAAPRRGVVFVIPPLHLSTFFPLSFYPFYFFLLSPIPSSSSPPPSITSIRVFDLVGESASNEPIAENLSSRARRDPTSHPPHDLSPPPPACSPFTPSSPPDCPGFIPGHCPRRVLPRDTPRLRRGEGGHETGIKRFWKDCGGGREREAPFDHRFAAAREIAVFFAPDGKWPRFCPSVSSCRLLLARISIVCCHSSRTTISSINSQAKIKS